MLFSLHHSAIGRTTHQEGVAGAHVTYVTRRRAASSILSARLPVAKPGAATETRAWFDAHEAKSRKNARVADKMMIALPIELDAEQRETLVSDFAEALTSSRAPWLAAIHAAGKDAANPHAHVVVVDRDPTTGKRVIGMSEKGSTERVRLLWEQHVNAALAAAGIVGRIDRRSLAAQGIDRQAEIHVGPKSAAMTERGVRPESRDRIDNRGREIRWTEIDGGRTRSEHRAEIIEKNAAAAAWAALALIWPVMPTEGVEPAPGGVWEAWAEQIITTRRREVFEALDQRRQRLKTALAILAKAIDPPPALAAARAQLDELVKRERALARAAADLSRRQTALEKQRPRRLFASFHDWVSERRRVRMRALADVAAEREQTRSAWRQAREACDEQETLLEPIEAAWEWDEKEIKATRARRRGLIEDRLAWITDAKFLASKSDAVLYASRSRLDDEIKAFREARVSAEPRSLKFSTAPTYRPR